jgi:hypothetical protein
MSRVANEPPEKASLPLARWKPRLSISRPVAVSKLPVRVKLSLNSPDGSPLSHPAFWFWSTQPVTDPVPSAYLTWTVQKVQALITRSLRTL